MMNLGLYELAYEDMIEFWDPKVNVGLDGCEMTENQQRTMSSKIYM